MMVRMSRRALHFAAVIAVACGAALVLLPTRGDESPPSAASSRAVEERFNRDSDRDVPLRAGIHVSSSGPAERGGSECHEVRLHNPTAPNVAWLRERYGPSLCVDERPVESTNTTLIGCSEGAGPKVRVPDVRGLRAHEAALQLRRAGFLTDCNRSWERRPERLRYSGAMVVEKVCSSRVRRGGTVYMRVEAVLPGGFRVIGEDCFGSG